MTPAPILSAVPLLLAALLTASPAAGHHAVAHDILVTATPRVHVDPSSASTARAYVSLRNRSRHEHTLIAAESPVAADVRLVAQPPSAPTGPDPHAGSAGMAVPARGTLHLVPAGAHILLRDLTTALTPGDTVAVTLRFQDQSVLKLIAEVHGP